MLNRLQSFDMGYVDISIDNDLHYQTFTIIVKASTISLNEQRYCLRHGLYRRYLVTGSVQ